MGLGRGSLTYEISPPVTDFVHQVEMSYADNEGREHTILKQSVGTTSGLNIGTSAAAPANVDFVNLTFTFSAFTNRSAEFIVRPDYAKQMR
jgi:hypothetical protein